MGIEYIFLYGIRLTEEDIFRLFPENVFTFLQQKTSTWNVTPFKTMPTPEEVWDSNIGYNVGDLFEVTHLRELIGSSKDLVGYTVDYDNICIPKDTLEFKNLLVLGVVVQKCSGSCQVSSAVPSLSDEHKEKWVSFVKKCPALADINPGLFVYASD